MKNEFKTYTNPFKLENEWDGNLGDPFIMRCDGRYYLYCSSHGKGIKCWISDDLMNWEYFGSVCEEPEVEGAYAPEVCFTRGKFYMVTSPKGSGHYLLESASPTGPFKLVTENFGLLIDGSMFVDDDGKEYFLRAGHRGIMIHKMCPPSAPETSGTTIPESYLNHWTEGPMIIKRDGYYYLTDTGNHLLSRGYRIDYCVSKVSPAEGYVTPRNKTLLLEVGDDFHALGHSSTVLGPDMDSYFIAYHSYNFIAEPRFRSLNIDRLFFNGARMYANTTWWEQPAPRLPVFTSRGGEGLETVSFGGREYLFTPDAGEFFTAEINVNPMGKNVSVILGGQVFFEINGEKDFPPNVDFNANITVRIARGAEKIKIWINNMLIKEFPRGGGEDLFNAKGEGADDLFSAKGGIGIYSEAGQKPGFVGFSSVSEGSGDYDAPKSVPGRFSAVHAVNAPARVETDDYGLTANAAPAGGKSLTYKLNVKESGEYTVFLRVLPEEKALGAEKSSECIKAGLTVNGKKLEFSNGIYPGMFSVVNAGTVELAKGVNDLILSDFCGIQLLDEIELTAFGEITEPITVVEEGKLVCSAVNIMGHKNKKSMLRKEWGFTCAENHGMGFVLANGMSDGSTNYSVNAKININPNTDGTASIFLRAVKESWFAQQASPSFIGYSVTASKDGVRLYRCDYGKTEAAFMAFSGVSVNEIDLSIDVKSGQISVSCGGSGFNYFDPEAYAHGKVGFEATGEGYGFEYMKILPL